jgi:ribosomal protein S20
MPITKEQEQTQAINTNVGISSPNIKTNLYAFESMNKLYAQLGEFGSQISTEFGHQYGKELAQKHILEEVDKGANGNYNSTNAIMALTPAGKAYNQLMEQAKNTIIPSRLNEQIQEQYNTVLNNPKIEINHKVQALDQGLNNLIKQPNIESLDPSVQNIIHGQVYDAHRSMIKQQTTMLTNQQLDSTINAFTQSKNNAINSKDINVANNNLKLAFDSVDSGVNAGLIDPVKATAMKSDAKVEVISGFAISNNINGEQLKQFGAEKGLTTEEMNKVQYAITADFNRKQTQIKAQQLQSGFDYEQSRANSIISGKPMPLANYTAEQTIMNKHNFIAHNLYYQASTANSDEARQELLSSSQYQGLDSEAKTIVNSNLGKIQRGRTRVPDLSMYGIDHETPYMTRRQIAQDLDPTKLFFPDEIQRYRNNLSANVNSYNEVMRDSEKWGPDRHRLLDYFLKGGSKNSDGDNDSRVYEDPTYVDGKFIASKPTGKFGNVAFQSEQTQILEAFQNSGLPEEYSNKSARAIFDHIQKVGDSRGTYQDSVKVLKDRYDYSSNHILHKGDEVKLNENNYSNIYNTISSNKNIKNRFPDEKSFREFMDKATIVPDGGTDSYYIGNKDGDGLRLPYKLIDTLPLAPNTSLTKKILKAGSGFISYGSQNLNLATQYAKDLIQGNDNE